MGGLPDALFIIDVGYEKIALLEANKLGIPVVAVVDTNNSPDGVDYIIPGNDDSMRAIKLYCRAAADAINEGKATITTAIGDDEIIEVIDDEPVAPAPKKAAAKKAAPKKAAPKKAAAKKAEEAPAEEAPAEEAPAAEAEEKAPAKKAVKKAATKKAATKKAATKKAATKKAATKKAAAKKDDEAAE